MNIFDEQRHDQAMREQRAAAMGERPFPSMNDLNKKLDLIYMKLEIIELKIDDINLDDLGGRNEDIN